MRIMFTADEEKKLLMAEAQRLAEDEGLSYTDIATKTGLPSGSIGSACSREKWATPLRAKKLAKQWSKDGRLLQATDGAVVITGKHWPVGESLKMIAAAAAQLQEMLGRAVMVDPDTIPKGQTLPEPQTVTAQAQAQAQAPASMATPDPVSDPVSLQGAAINVQEKEAPSALSFGGPAINVQEKEAGEPDKAKKGGKLRFGQGQTGPSAINCNNHAGKSEMASPPIDCERVRMEGSRDVGVSVRAAGGTIEALRGDNRGGEASVSSSGPLSQAEQDQNARDLAEMARASITAAKNRGTIKITKVSELKTMDDIYRRATGQSIGGGGSAGPPPPSVNIQILQEASKGEISPADVTTIDADVIDA